MTVRPLSPSVALLLCCLAVPAAAFEDTVSPPRVDTPPVLDGYLDDPVWDNAARPATLIQQEPDLGEPVSERTEIRIIYTASHLYIGAILYDQNPELQSANIFSRDGPLFQDDSFIVSLDANNDNRTAVQIAVNGNGARLDREVVEGGAFNTSFNIHWRVAVRRDDEGIHIEIEIPFAELSFPPAEQYEMGLLIRRLIPRKRELAYWPAISRDYTFASVSQYGRLIGLRDLKLGRNLEISPSAIAGSSENPAGEETEIDASLDARWGITSGLTADLTFNTDFAQVESDALQVNLTRFSLFFPEKREFFLENAGLFQFGSLQRAEAFFSRRIGMYQGREVPILAGARVHGLIGNTNVGVLNVRTDETAFTDAENFFVARLKHNVGQRSTIGGIVTRRSGFTPEEDTTVGLDARHVWGSQNILFVSAARSDRGVLDEAQNYLNLGYERNSDTWNLFAGYTDIDPGYNPGIGFVPRPDQKRTRLFADYRPRPAAEAIRQLSFQAGYSSIRNHADILETETYEFKHSTFFESGDTLTLETIDTYDLIQRPFRIAPNVTIQPGGYDFRRYRVELHTNNARRYEVESGYQWGSFYDGNIKRFYFFGLLKVVPRFHIETFNELNQVDLSDGSFQNNVHRVLASYFFSPNINLRVATQYRSLDESVVANLRLRWIFGQGSEAWLVYDEDRDLDLEFDTLRNRTIVAKLVYRFRM